MGRGIDIPCIGGRYTMVRGLDIAWVGRSIHHGKGVGMPWVGGRHTIGRGSIYHG
jgi:hypothetical protein